MCEQEQIESHQSRSHQSRSMVVSVLLVFALFAAVVLFMFLKWLSMPDPEAHSTHSYFGSAVTVEYQGSRLDPSRNYLTFRFEKEGLYDVSFSSKRNEEKSYKPHDFTRVVKTPPQEVTLKQDKLPSYLQPYPLTVTITRDAGSIRDREWHNFP